MFLLFLALIGSGLISILVFLLMAAVYGLGLIFLVGAIRNVRQEISRNNLRRLLLIISIDHGLTAALAITLAFLIVFVPAARYFLPLMIETGMDGEGLIVMTSLICVFFSMLWVAVGGLLFSVQDSLKTRTSLRRELDWEPWLTVLIVIGCVLQLGTGFFFLLVAAPLIWQVNRLARFNRQGNLIWTLSLAVSRGLPLGKEVLALAQCYWGRQRLRLELLSENLDAGQSIANSLERQPGLVPFSVAMQIRMGEETGTVSHVLTNCGTAQSGKYLKEEEIVSTQQAFMILLIPLALLPLIMAFLAVNLVPKYKSIFSQFGIDPGELPKAVFQMADVYAGLPILAIIVSFVLVGLLFRDWERDWPFLSWWAPRANAPPILRSLALLIRENRPVSPGLEALETSHVRLTVRKQLTRILTQIDKGINLWDALAAQRLIGSHDLMLLHAAERVRNLPWALEQLAETIERRYWQRFRVILEILFPLATILIGLVVLVIAVAFTLPLAKTIYHLS